MECLCPLVHPQYACALTMRVLLLLLGVLTVEWQSDPVLGIHLNPISLLCRFSFAMASFPTTVGATSWHWSAGDPAGSCVREGMQNACSAIQSGVESFSGLVIADPS